MNIISPLFSKTENIKESITGLDQIQVRIVIQMPFHLIILYSLIYQGNVFANAINAAIYGVNNKDFF